MVFHFILQVLTFASLGFLVYIFTRALPRLDESLLNQKDNAHRDYLDEFIRRLPLEKADTTINMFIGKALRRLRVVIMKIDNYIIRYLNKINKNGNGNNININGK